MRMFLCFLAISGSNLSCDFSLFIFIKVVCVGPGLEITIGSMRDFLCPSSILSVPKWKEEGLHSVKFCFPKLLM